MTEQDCLWLNAHSNLLKLPNEALSKYGVIKYYDLTSISDKEKHFIGDFILIFDGGLLEDWGIGNIEALASLLEHI